MTIPQPVPDRDFYSHLPRTWREELSLTLRLRGASGARIGDVLAVAEAHCAQSGQGAQQAFGAAEQYAAAIPLSEHEHPDGFAELAKAALPSMVGLAGMMLTFTATNAWLSEQAAEASWGAAAGVVGIFGVSVAVVRWFGVFARRRWAFAVLVGLVASAFTAATLGADAAAFTLPTPVAALTGVALLAAGALWGRQQLVVDPVTDPLRGDPTPRITRLVAAIQPWLFPVATAIGVLLIVLIDN